MPGGFDAKQASIFYMKIFIFVLMYDALF